MTIPAPEPATEENRTMARFRVAYNPTDRPVLIDDEGRTLGGGDYGPVRPRAEEVIEAAARDELVILPETMHEAANPVVVAAYERAAELDRLAQNAGPSDLTDEAINAMSARELGEHLLAWPGDVDRVDAIEAARPQGPRSTVTDAIARIRPTIEEVR